MRLKRRSSRPSGGPKNATTITMNQGHKRDPEVTSRPVHDDVVGYRVSPARAGRRALIVDPITIESIEALGPAVSAIHASA